MNAYQEKWIEVLNHAHIKDWKISAQDDDIMIELPPETSVKTVMENLPEVIATLSLDMEVPKQRLKFVLKKGGEQHEYLLNPTDQDLNTDAKI